MLLLRRIEIRLQISDAQFFPIETSVPIEFGGLYGAVAAIGSVDRVKHHRAIFHGTANRAELVHAPGKGHRAGAGHEAKCGTQAGAAAARAGRGNRAKRFGANAESDAARGRGGRRAGGRAARSLRGIPWIARLGTEPAVVHRERAQAEFCDEHGASCVEAFYDCGVLVEFLVFEAACAPRGGITRDSEQIFSAPRKPVQWTAMFSPGEIAVCFFGFCDGAVFGERDDEVQQGIVALEAVEIHLRERERRNLFRAHEFSEMSRAEKADIFEIFRDVARGDGRCFRDHDGALDRFKLRAGEHRIKHERGRDAIGDVQLVNFLVAFDPVVQAIEHHLAVVFRNGDARDGGGFVDHVQRDGGLVLSEREEHAW